MSKHSVLTRIRAFIVLSLISVPAFAATVTKINDDALAPLRETTVTKKIRLEKLPLYDGKRSVIDLEEFQVWAPGGKVAVHRGPKDVQYVDPPAMRFFRGTVNNDPESLAYFSIEVASGKMYGLVATRDRKYAITGVPRRMGAVSRHPVDERTSDGIDYFLSADDASDAIPQTEATWTCAGESPSFVVRKERSLTKSAEFALTPVTTAASGTQKYEIAVNVETDYELYHTGASDNLPALTAYISNLTGAVSTIYNRDLNTNVVQNVVHTYTTVNDPWTAIDALGAVPAGTQATAGLNEIGDFYHNGSNGFPAPSADGHSAVVMLSGRNIGVGVAWEGVIGGADFFQNSHWGGSYAYCAGIANLGSVGLGSIPTTNVNTAPYGLPTGTQNYWPLVEYAHELGHNLGGHHTHCVAITSGEAAGTNHPSQLFVDMCHTGEIDQYFNGVGFTSVPCATGSDYTSSPTEKGTIMSYCHNIFVTGVPQSRFTFGQPAEVSAHELNDYMLRSSGPLPPVGGSNNIVNSTPTASAITAPSSVGANSTGNTASITVTGNGVEGTSSTIAWSATGGTITSATNTASITFTAGATGTVVLTVKVTNNYQVTLTDSKTVTISAVSVLPPTNVAAVGTSSTSIQITWTPSVTGGITGYNIYRSADNANFGLVGSASSIATSFNDTGGTGPSTNKAYVYAVRAVVSATESPDGGTNKDFAVCMTFTTDPTLTAGMSIKAAHITQLRTAAAALRTLVNPVATTTFAEAIAAGTTTIKASHISELRTYISGARTALGFSAGTYSTTPGIGSVISVADINDLRNAAK